jgi:hypothetical protein
MAIALGYISANNFSQRNLHNSLKFWAVAGMAFISGAASAVGTQTGRITEVHVRASDGLIYFILSGPASGRPVCATAPYWLVKDENSQAGKQQFAELMLAYSTGTKITVSGTGACTRWADGEDLNDLSLNTD